MGARSVKMVESVGMQQVLQMSSTVEKANVSPSNQLAATARAFEDEMKKTTDLQLEQVQETKATEEAKIRDEDLPKHHRQAKRPPGGGAHKDDAEEEEVVPIKELGVGGQINIVA